MWKTVVSERTGLLVQYWTDGTNVFRPARWLYRLAKLAGAEDARD